MAIVLTLLLLLFVSSPTARAADDEHQFTVVALSSLKPHAACSGHRVMPPYNGSWVPLYRPLGPCSPSPPPGAARPSLADLLRQDQLRVDDIHRRLPGGFRDRKASAKEPAVVENAQLQHKCIIQVNIGSQRTSSKRSIDPTVAGGDRWSLPGVVQTVVLDTGSDVPWVRCAPCAATPCHPQADAVYDTANSSTYAAVPCDATACAQLVGLYANGCGAGNRCQYRVAYSDNSSSSGTYGSDLLTVDAANAVANFQFGCSYGEHGGGFDNTTAGIMALGGGPESLASQAAAAFGGAFSYCVPPTGSAKGFFVLGVPHEASSRFALTPMLRYKTVPTFYRVLLRGITVAGKPLDVAPSAFAAGAVLDSRTAITQLPPNAYMALRAAFRSSMSSYRQAPPQGGLDTCYDLAGAFDVRLPRIALVFDRNATVELDPSGILFEGCLAFAANREDRMPGVLGNVLQQTIEVLYDVGGGTVGFRPGAC